MSNKSLIVVKNGLVHKIKSFFNSLFNKNNKGKHDLNDNKVVDSSSNKSGFMSNVKVEPDLEREQLVKLQKDYESGIINEKDMTEEQVNKIEKLYIEQISKLRDEFVKKRDKARTLKSNMVSNS